MYSDIENLNDLIIGYFVMIKVIKFNSLKRKWDIKPLKKPLFLSV